MSGKKRASHGPKESADKEAERESTPHSKKGLAESPQAQFPKDPSRASEAGYAYGEAAPEPPGRRMNTPPPQQRSASQPIADRERARDMLVERQKERRKKQFVEELRNVSERIGPRGNFRP